MHPAQREGTNAGTAAAVEDRHSGAGRGVGAELVLAARESAEEWATAGAPLFIDRNGQSIAAYIEAFTVAYDAWMDEHAARKAGRRTEG